MQHEYGFGVEQSFSEAERLLELAAHQARLFLRQENSFTYSQKKIFHVHGSKSMLKLNFRCAAAAGERIACHPRSAHSRLHSGDR
jgi:hypothetical protein